MTRVQIFKFLVPNFCLLAKYVPTTVKDNPRLSELKGQGTSKLEWRYFEHNKVDRNELQVCKNLHKDTGTKMTEKLNNLTEIKYVIFVPVPLCIFANKI